MIYVYAPSMAIITWSAKRWLLEDIIYISYNNQIEKFCKKCNIKFIRINSNTDKSYRGLIKHKKYIKEFAKQFSNCEVIFGHNSHDYWGLFFINTITKENTIYYNKQQEEHKKTNIFKEKFSKGIILKLKDVLIILLITRLKLNVLKFNSMFLGLSKTRISKYKAHKKKTNNHIFYVNKTFISNKYKLDEIEFILIDQGNVFYEYNKEILSYLVNFSKIHNLYLKQHPTFSTVEKELIYNLNHLPKEIPVEFVITEKTIVIGVASNAMRQVKKSISLLELVDMNSDDKFKYMLFIQSTSVIVPKNINELEYHLDLLVK